LEEIYIFLSNKHWWLIMIIELDLKFSYA
jgi:hypothetical protein